MITKEVRSKTVKHAIYNVNGEEYDCDRYSLEDVKWWEEHKLKNKVRDTIRSINNEIGKNRGLRGGGSWQTTERMIWGLEWKHIEELNSIIEIALKRRKQLNKSVKELE
tara:strand:+ start:405 stop:731 length:327 start_codon:yes stop_codon:yes gene_type:complete